MSKGREVENTKEFYREEVGGTGRKVKALGASLRILYLLCG